MPTNGTHAVLAGARQGNSGTIYLGVNLEFLNATLAETVYVPFRVQCVRVYLCLPLSTCVYLRPRDVSGNHEPMIP